MRKYCICDATRYCTPYVTSITLCYQAALISKSAFWGREGVELGGGSHFSS